MNSGIGEEGEGGCVIRGFWSCKVCCLPCVSLGAWALSSSASCVSLLTLFILSRYPRDYMLFLEPSTRAR